MKIFSIFSVFSKTANSSSTKLKSECACDLTSTSGSVNTGESSRSGKSGNSHKTKKIKKERRAEVEVEEDEMTVNIRAVEAYMHSMNAYRPDDPEGYMQRMADFYASKDADIILEDGEAYKTDALNKGFVGLYESFPDFKMQWSDVMAVDKKPNRIGVEGIFASGTHTGKPYSLLPGVLPEIPPTGKYVVNDEQRFEFEVRNGKIIKVEVFALGTYTGFSGFYQRAAENQGKTNPDEPVKIKVEEEE